MKLRMLEAILPLLQYVFTAWRLAKHKDVFAFAFLKYKEYGKKGQIAMERGMDGWMDGRMDGLDRQIDR